MLDKALHKHLDTMESLKEELENDIDKIYSGIDIESVVKNPTEAVNSVTLALQSLLKEKYLPIAVKHGFDLAGIVKENMKKNKEIKIQDSNDPTLNKEIVDGDNGKS